MATYVAPYVLKLQFIPPLCFMSLLLLYLIVLVLKSYRNSKTFDFIFKMLAALTFAVAVLTAKIGLQYKVLAINNVGLQN